MMKLVITVEETKQAVLDYLKKRFPGTIGTTLEVKYDVTGSCRDDQEVEFDGFEAEIEEMVCDPNSTGIFPKMIPASELTNEHWQKEEKKGIETK